MAAIIVTARRQAENSQKVPIAITALSQESLERQNIQDINTLQFAVPSLSVNGQMGDLLVLNIRGQGAGSQQSQAGVVVYLNEVPLCCDNNGGTIGGPGLYYDLENVQVLKGPQGTLFGRNSMGGAVLLQTRRPTEKFEGYVQGGFGTYNNRELSGAINVPITDQLAVRVAGFWQKRDGYARSLGSPSHPNGLDIDNANLWSGRATVTWKPLEGVKNDLIYQHFHSSNNNSSFAITALSPNIGAVFGPALGGFLDSLVQQQQTMGIRKTLAVGTDPFFHTNYDSLTDILTVELSPEITFRNIASWSNIKRELGVDYDGTILPILDFPFSGQNDTQWTEEAQLQGKTGRLNWTVGAYLSRIPKTPTVLANSVVFFGPLKNDPFSYSYKSTAVYAQGTYDLSSLTEGLKFTAGFRYTWDEQTYDLKQLDANFQCTNPPPPGTDANCRIYSAGKWSAPAWTLGLDYQVTPTTLVYLQHRHAYRTGGFNTHADAPFSDPFDPETVNDIEIGLKSDFRLFGMPTRVNAAAYRQWYKDIQVAVTRANPQTNGFANFVTNGARATIQGVELEGNVRVTPNLDLGANFAYLNFKFNEFDPSALPADIIAMEANRTASRPPYKFNLSAQYTRELPDNAGEISFGANYNWQSTSGPDRELAQIKAFGLLNFNAAWKNIMGQPVELSVYMTNATNVKRSYSIIPLYDAALFNVGYFYPPRTYGFRVRYDF